MSKSKLIVALAMAAALAAIPVSASESEAKHAKQPEAQHEKDGDRHEPAEGTQQHRMKTCNAEAGKKELKGEERRAFMSACLRKPS